MKCNEKETLSLGALLSNEPPQPPKPQHNMLKSLKTLDTTSSPSTASASASASNIIACSTSDPELTATPSTTLLQSLKFDVDLDAAEVQSPDNSIWDSFFADQLVDPSTTDFMLISSPRRDYMMISSPKRDYMISSPRRDYMTISSPKRDYMISSPKREYMVTVTSPKRSSMGSSAMSASLYTHNYGYVHGVQPYVNSIDNSGFNTRGKSPSPLHKVFNSSSYGTGVGPETAAAATLALPTMDALLDEYGLYGNLKEECAAASEQAYEVAGAGDQVEEAVVGGMTATLLECLAMPSLNARYGEGGGVSELGHGDDDGHGHHGYGHGHGMGGHYHDHELMGSVSNCKSELVEDMSSKYQGLLGPMASSCEQTEQEQDRGLQLVHLLLACAESVAKDDYISARRFLHHLNRIVSPLGDSMQRVASCFADALSCRLSPPLPPPSSPKSPSLDTLKIYQILYQACPYIKFAHFTANQAIFEAFEAEDRVHVIDLDILQGYQWPAFLQALAARPGGPPSLRITGVGYPAELVRETGRHLAELAHSLRVPFEFHPAVADRLQDLRPHMLHRRVGEALAVNSVNRLHRVPAPHLGNLLAMIRDQAPNIVTLVEQEASHNGPHFLGRFLEALHYYSAIFDSLDATFPADSAARAKVEQYIFLPEIRNIVACEGPDRLERHERLERWRKVMEGKGFKGVALSQNAVAQSQILLGLYSSDGYRLTEDKGCLLLGWQDRAIIAASAWRC